MGPIPFFIPTPASKEKLAYMVICVLDWAKTYQMTSGRCLEDLSFPFVPGQDSNNVPFFRYIPSYNVFLWNHAHAFFLGPLHNNPSHCWNATNREFQEWRLTEVTNSFATRISPLFLMARDSDARDLNKKTAGMVLQAHVIMEAEWKSRVKSSCSKKLLRTRRKVSDASSVFVYFLGSNGLRRT